MIVLGAAIVLVLTARASSRREAQRPRSLLSSTHTRAPSRRSNPSSAGAGPLRATHRWPAAGVWAPALLTGVLADLVPLQADAQVERELRDVLVAQHDLALVLAQDLHPEREPLQLLDQHPEALRDAGLERVVALDDRLVRLDAAHDVVRLDGQDLLEHVGGPVGLQRPDLHLAEALTAELRLAAQRLLGDQAVRTGRARVDLVLDQVVELEHVDPPHRHRLVELLTRPAVAERDLAVRRQPVLLQVGADGLQR